MRAATVADLVDVVQANGLDPERARIFVEHGGECSLADLRIDDDGDLVLVSRLGRPCPIEPEELGTYPAQVDELTISDSGSFSITGEV